MRKIVYINDGSRNSDACSGEKYFDFLDYAFSKTDFFMLVYVNYYGKGYSQKKKYFKKALEPFKIKSRNNPSWPGTINTFCRDTTYKVVFYRNDPRAKSILKEASSLSSWKRPEYPEDLAFFNGNRCWFYSVGHENISAIIDADEEDIYFLKSKGISSIDNVRIHEDSCFDQYDEILIREE